MKTDTKFARKRRHSNDDCLLGDLKMSDRRDTNTQKQEMKTDITSDAAAKVVAVALNERLVKAKENEPDSLPSDDEDGYPDLKLDPAKIAEHKRQAAAKAAMEKQKDNR